MTDVLSPYSAVVIVLRGWLCELALLNDSAPMLLEEVAEVMVLSGTRARDLFGGDC